MWKRKIARLLVWVGRCRVVSYLYYMGRVSSLPGEDQHTDCARKWFHCNETNFGALDKTSVRSFCSYSLAGWHL